MKKLLLSVSLLISLSFSSQPDINIEFFEEEAERGNVEYQVKVGVLYLEGEHQDYERATKWLNLAAKQNHPLAFSIIGMRYYRGLGVPQDYHEAKKWFIKACDNGLQGACETYEELNLKDY